MLIYCQQKQLLDLLASIKLKRVEDNRGINVLRFFSFLFQYSSSKEVLIYVALGHMSHSFDKESKDILTLVISLSFTNCLWLDLIPTLSAWLNRLCTYDMCIFFSELIYFYFQLVSGRRESYLSLWSKYLDSRFFVPFQY